MSYFGKDLSVMLGQTDATFIPTVKLFQAHVHVKEL